MVTARLADAGRSVCLLERGKAYPPGSFPRRPAEMSRNFWDPSEGLHGLFSAWSFKGLDALVASGLGGGSLIYANVLLRKDENWFVESVPGGGEWRWPVTRADLDPHYDVVEKKLAAQRFPLGQPGYERVLKTAAMKEAATAAGLEWGLPPLAVTFGNPSDAARPGDIISEPRGNLHGRPRLTCLLCGECDIGCNYGSKNTLDFNYLTEAARAGAELRTLCEVRRFGPGGNGGFWVEYVQHLPENEGRPTDTRRLPVARLSCKRLVLSAGALGTTFLLLKNRDEFPSLSSVLGSRFSGNGDLLGFFFHGRKSRRRFDSSSGPVITSFSRAADAADGGEGRGFYIEDGGIPGFAGWLMEASDLTGGVGRALRFAAYILSRRILRRFYDTELSAEVHSLLGDADSSSSFLPILGMGRDTADGRMFLDRDRGRLQIDWTIETSQEYFSRLRTAMVQMAKALGARFKTNPTYLLDRVVTVHPLGGCPMGHNPEEGVVDAFGQVFGYPGLYIADGSVMPGPVGANPALTIAAMADRTAGHIIRSLKENHE